MKTNTVLMMSSNHSRNNYYQHNDDTSATSSGLIQPKKLRNPCLESMEKVQLHRELLFNQKIGKNVLNQKSELERTFERKLLKTQYRDTPTTISTSPLTSEFQKVLAERAKRLSEHMEEHQADINNNNSENMNAFNEIQMVKAKLKKSNV